MLYVVDENGEVKDIVHEHESVAKVKPGDRVVRGGSVEYLLGTVQVRFNKFIKVNDLACVELQKYGNFLFLLFQYVGFADGILVFSNGRRLRPKFLHGLFKKKRKSGTKIIQEMIDLDIIHKHEEGRTYYFTMNPFICVKGSRITKELYDEFKDTKYRRFGDDKPDLFRSLNEKTKIK